MTSALERGWGGLRYADVLLTHQDLLSVYKRRGGRGVWRMLTFCANGRGSGGPKAAKPC